MKGETILPPLVALAIALVIGDLLILSFGESPAAVYALLIEGTWGNAYGIGQVLYKATTLTCTGLSGTAHTAPAANSRESPGRKGVTTSPVSQKTMPNTTA